VWELRSPTHERKGFLPIATTRGDRLFIGLLAAVYVNLAWIGISAEGSTSWPGSLASLLVLLAIMWKG
jgi:predicted small integral membrane protein